MTKLSVNINKVALIRNARGGNLPDLVEFAKDCESFGAQGITVHPRPDERHIRYRDIAPLKKIVRTEFNIEGYPSEEFLDLVCLHRPHQCTLVPDPPNVLTSDSGWQTIKNKSFLRDVVLRLQEAGIRTSLFVDPEANMIEGAAEVGTDRIEFYTGEYAHRYHQDKVKAIAPFIMGAKIANNSGLGINAGHDLNLENLRFFHLEVPGLLEVSIGHALISDALYFGIQNVIEMYLRLLR